jgi:hypothetical protein
MIAVELTLVDRRELHSVLHQTPLLVRPTADALTRSASLRRADVRVRRAGSAVLITAGSICPCGVQRRRRWSTYRNPLTDTGDIRGPAAPGRTHVHAGSACSKHRILRPSGEDQSMCHIRCVLLRGVDDHSDRAGRPTSRPLLLCPASVLLRIAAARAHHAPPEKFRCSESHDLVSTTCTRPHSAGARGQTGGTCARSALPNGMMLRVLSDASSSSPDAPAKGIVCHGAGTRRVHPRAVLTMIVEHGRSAMIVRRVDAE